MGNTSVCLEAVLVVVVLEAAMRLCTAKHIVQRQKLSIEARVEVLLKKTIARAHLPSS